jgi:hypothetical protein
MIAADPHKASWTAGTADRQQRSLSMTNVPVDPDD